MCPAWTLRAWPPLLWQVSRDIPLHLQHLGTQITDPGNGVFRTAGQTLWAWHCDEGEAGMAWDWVELGRGVVAMADPLAVMTNLRLVSEDGDTLTHYESARHINGIVHKLPWQGEVERVLNALADRIPAAALTIQRLGSWQRTTPVSAH